MTTPFGLVRLRHYHERRRLDSPCIQMYSPSEKPLIVHTRRYHRVMILTLSLSAAVVVVSLTVPHYRDTPAETAFDDDILRSDVDPSSTLSHLTAGLSATPPTMLALVLASPVVVSAHAPLPTDIPRTVLAVRATAPRSPPLIS